MLFLCGKEPDSDLTRDIAESIARAKKNRKWEREYVQFIEKMREERNIGRAEGRAEGLAEGRAEGLAEGRAEGLAEGRAEARDESARLFAFAKETGRLDEYGQAFEDEEVRQKLLADIQAYWHKA